MHLKSSSNNRFRHINLLYRSIPMILLVQQLASILYDDLNLFLWLSAESLWWNESKRNVLRQPAVHIDWMMKLALYMCCEEESIHVWCYDNTRTYTITMERNSDIMKTIWALCKVCTRTHTLARTYTHIHTLYTHCCITLYGEGATRIRNIASHTLLGNFRRYLLKLIDLYEKSIHTNICFENIRKCKPLKEKVHHTVLLDYTRCLWCTEGHSTLYLHFANANIETMYNETGVPCAECRWA